MQFSFSGRSLPMTVRVCRSLVWAEAAYTMLSGVFVVLVATLLGANEAIPFRGATLSGGGAVVLGAVYVAAGLLIVWLGFELGRLAPWARTVIVSMQVFLAVLQFFRSFDLSLSLLINVGLYVAIIALLFAPDTHRALEGAAQG
ncbi:MAG: hypothetical protein NVS3B18_15170 [Candidatus Dormibacteria bacterium]